MTNEVATTEFQQDKSLCPAFADPLPDMLVSLNKAMLYAGAAAAKEDKAYLKAHMDEGMADRVNRTVAGIRLGDQLVFETSFAWFCAAALVELVCIALILPTYWEFWTLGRPVSFSPLEIAKVDASTALRV